MDYFTNEPVVLPVLLIGVRGVPQNVGCILNPISRMLFWSFIEFAVGIRMLKKKALVTIVNRSSSSNLTFRAPDNLHFQK